jgi:hypothetical protein
MNDIEFEYADYCINKLCESIQSADDIDWIDRKTHRYDERLNNKEQEEVRAILVEDKWIERYKQSTLYSLNKSKLPILKEHGSYSNYCKYLDKEYQLSQSKLNNKVQLETEVLKLQKENLERSSKIILDVFEIVNYNPVLKYKISVIAKFIILVSNNDVPRTGVCFVVDKHVREKLVLYELTDIEKFDFGSQLTHKFKIKSFGKNYLFLKLTDDDLIKLGFIEKPKSFWEKLIDFSVNGVWIWLERIGFVLTIPLAIIVFRQCSFDAKNQKLKLQQETQSNQIDSIINSKDSINISETDSSLKN